MISTVSWSQLKDLSPSLPCAFEHSFFLHFFSQPGCVYICSHYVIRASQHDSDDNERTPGAWFARSANREDVTRISARWWYVRPLGFSPLERGKSLASCCARTRKFILSPSRFPHDASQTHRNDREKILGFSMDLTRFNGSLFLRSSNHNAHK